MFKRAAIIDRREEDTLVLEQALRVGDALRGIMVAGNGDDLESRRCKLAQEGIEQRNGLRTRRRLVVYVTGDEKGGNLPVKRDFD